MSSYDDGLLYYRSDYAVGYKSIKSYSYEYSTEGTLEYCRTKEEDDEGYVNKKSYYEGTVDNLQLVGYSIIDSRDENKDDKKTKESVCNASGTKLYYVEFTLAPYSDGAEGWYISDKNWFKADGTSIDVSAIAESWVTVLVR